MYNTKQNTAPVSSETDYYYCSGDYEHVQQKSPENTNASNDKSGSSNIFDTPEFVIDAYLDAKNGGSSKDEGILILSTKYAPTDAAQMNTNCNHNTKGDCGCSAEKEKAKTCHEGEVNKKASHDDSAKCPCSDSIYEKGEKHNQEFPKKQCCSNENPYEVGESPFEEPPKDHICACNCMEDSGSAYELGAPPFKKNAPCDVPKTKPEKLEQCDPRGPCNKIDFTAPCSGSPFSEFESEIETGALVMSNIPEN